MITTIRAIIIHFNNRIAEAVKAVIMIGIGIQMIAFPASHFPALRLISMVTTEGMAMALFLIVGFMRIAALIANGSWPEYGPWMRSIGALVGALIWSNMFLSLVLVTPPDQTTLGAPIFFVFTVVEFISIYRALAVRSSDGRGI